MAKNNFQIRIKSLISCTRRLDALTTYMYMYMYMYMYVDEADLGRTRSLTYATSPLLLGCSVNGQNKHIVRQHDTLVYDCLSLLDNEMFIVQV